MWGDDRHQILSDAIREMCGVVEVSHANIKKYRGDIVGQMPNLSLPSSRIVTSRAKVDVVHHCESLFRNTIREEHAFVRTM